MRKTVTVVFSDVIGSTRLGEARDPESMRRVMSRYFDEARAVHERHGGTVEKFIGDAVMAVYGIPTLHEDDALRAVRAAAELRTRLDALNAEVGRDWGVRLQIRTGVNTGEVVAGDSSDGHAFATGDAVNLAKRFEEAARPAEILLGETTYRLVRDAVAVESVEALELKGKARRVAAYRLLDVARDGRSSRRLDAPMVGREHEQALLEQAYARAVRERSCHLFTVLGPAGIGKSRLAAEVIGSLQGTATTLTGRCLPYGEGITFWPIVELVRQAAGLREDDAPHEARAKIESLLEGSPEAEIIAERVAHAIGLLATPASPDETFWGVRKLLEALAQPGPLVVVFDDIHWAEPTFLDLVDHVGDWTRDAPILLLCLGRSELLDQRPGWSGGMLNATSILLEPLINEECEVLIENLLGHAQLPEVALRRIADAAEGNPLFVEEMLSMLIDDGLLRRENGRWFVAVDLDEVAVPLTIQALIAARLDRLDATERDVIGRAAVEGKVFHRNAVIELAPERLRPEVPSCLLTLQRKELIRPTRSDFAGDDAFRFRHLLIRDAAYDALPKQLRAELHERFATWLESAAVERVREYEEIVGYHLEQAYRYRYELGPPAEHTRRLARRAAERLANAGRRAFARGDMGAAGSLLSRAQSLLEPRAPGRAQLLADLGEALRETGDFDRAENVLAEVIESASAADDRVLEARALLIRLRLRLLTDPAASEDVVQEGRQLVETFEEAGDERLLAKAWELLAWAPWFRCRAAATDEALQRALDYSRRSGDARTEALSLNLSIAATFLGPMPVPDATRVCEEILAQPGQQRRITASALRALAGLKAMAGMFSEARELAAAHKELLEELGLKVSAASAAETYGFIEMLAGDPVAAEHKLAWGYGILDEIGESLHFPDLAAKLADALYAQGLDERSFELTEVSKLATAPADLSAGIQWRSVQAKLLARRGDITAGEALAREAVALGSKTDFLVLRAGALMDLAEVLRFAGGEGKAAAVVEQALALYEQKGSVIGAKRARAVLE
jgi:predicted ATPase/class 3 adenylate cyclase